MVVRVPPAWGRGVAESSLLTHAARWFAKRRPGGGAVWSFRGRARQAKHRLLAHALPISPEQLRRGTKRRFTRNAASGRSLAPLGACHCAKYRLST